MHQKLKCTDPNDYAEAVINTPASEGLMTNLCTSQQDDDVNSCFNKGANPSLNQL